MFEVIPSPGTEQKDWPAMEKRIEQIKPFAKSVHIDILDGKFAPNTSFTDPTPFTKYSKDIFFEVHLMVENPIDYIDEWVDAGFKRILGQIEGMEDIEEFRERCKELEVEVGLAVDGNTDVSEIFDYLGDLDTVLIMTINAGFSGQKFMPEHLDKVRAVREQTDIPIEVDGGVNLDSIKLAKSAGANRFVATSAIFNEPDPHKAFLTLQEAIR